jgi:twitching motility protein PilT
VTNLIREGKTFQIPSVMQTSKRLGMVTLNDALLELVDSGQVEPAEAYSKAVEKSGFVASLKSRGVDTAFADAEQGAKPPYALIYRCRTDILVARASREPYA